MTIGVPKEIKAQENRVSMIPGYVADLVKRGHRVVVRENAGVGSTYTDDQCLAAGAEIVPEAAAVFAEADMIVKVKEPQPSEVAMLTDKHILFTYLHLAANKELTVDLAATGCTAIAYETISVNRHLPLLEPMSEIAGRMSAIVGLLSSRESQWRAHTPCFQMRPTLPNSYPARTSSSVRFSFPKRLCRNHPPHHS